MHMDFKPLPGAQVVPLEVIERRIYLIRGQKVMLDSDLAQLYRVEVKTLNRQVRRNIKRFPIDFMFQLKKEENANLRCQNGTSSTSSRYGGRRYLPLVFTEQGVAMLSSVLNSERAISVNIAIMRTFVKLRELLASHQHLARKLEKMERTYDAQFRVVFKAIREQKELKPVPPSRRIGFALDSKNKS
jgi:di/tripeptidase